MYAAMQVTNASNAIIGQFASMEIRGVASQAAGWPRSILSAPLILGFSRLSTTKIQEATKQIPRASPPTPRRTHGAFMTSLIAIRAIPKAEHSVKIRAKALRQNLRNEHRQYFPAAQHNRPESTTSRTALSSAAPAM